MAHGFKGPIYCTRPSRGLISLILQDADLAGTFDVIDETTDALYDTMDETLLGIYDTIDEGI